MQTAQRQTQFATTSWSVKEVAAATIRLVLCWQERAMQRRHLSGLGDEALKDIGLSRADVAGESSKPFWRA